MGSNSFGTIFRITTWGESHGRAIGVVIDGCPAGLELSIEEIQKELHQRRPGFTPYTSSRKESDQVELLSGVFEGKTTGAPISLIIENRDVKSESYEKIKDLLRPGHAQFSYLQKYGIFDFRGGGRASARETACRVAAGAIAKKLLKKFDIEIAAYLKTVGNIETFSSFEEFHQIQDAVSKSPLFCPDPVAEKSMVALLQEVRMRGDSIGGIVEVQTSKLPQGIGDPVYEKLEANLAKAMLSLPATKGFEIGEGFQASKMLGSMHNDRFVLEGNKVSLETNHAGGTLGGISTGGPLLFRVAFKPTSSISLPQATVDLQGKEQTFALSENARHDPCVAIRAVPVVSAMTALVLADACLMHRSSQL